MCSDIVIKVENLSKCYQIYEAPRDRLKQFFYPRIQRWIGKVPKQYCKEFWALRDISFEIKKKETVGIIGMNGSGKSTLLQLICGTLHATKGECGTTGRVAALLELGSGFNPEFTGRENVYMNAAVLGLSKHEIDARFEAISAFADINDHMEQPIKTYSSGMTVRLAFSVIAHVDADILIIDEALAVGDAVFTQKCMRFLRKFMEKGTVLFVSHDTSAVNSLCKKAIWLHEGVIQMYDIAAKVTQAYTAFCAQNSYEANIVFDQLRYKNDIVMSQVESPSRDRDTQINFYENIANAEGWKSDAAEIKSVSISQENGQPVVSLSGGERLYLKVEIEIHKTLESPIVGFFVKDRLGQLLFGEHTFTYTQRGIAAHAGSHLIAEFVFRLPLLANGDYSMTVSIADGDPVNNVQHHWLHDAVLMHVLSPKLRYGLVGIPFDKVSLYNSMSQNLVYAE